MAFDRSKYKSTDLNEVEDDFKKAQSTMKNPNFSNQGGRASFYSVSKEGRYELRVLPAKSGKAYVNRKVVKLPIEVPVLDKEGNDTGKKEIRQKDVFTADVHSNRTNGKDAVMIYIDYVYALANEIQDNDERKKFLCPITGYFNKQKQWVWGVNATLNSVCYVYVDNEIHRLDLRYQWWKKMKQISIERSNDDILNLDIFSNPEEGYPLIINCYKDDKNKTQFDISCGLPDVNKRENWDDFFRRTRVSDEVLEILDELPTLEEMYIDVFSRKDWNLQIEGLERLDKQTGYNIFQNDSFLNELEELDKLIPEDDEVKKPSQKAEEKRVEKPKVEKKPQPGVYRQDDPIESEIPSQKEYPTLIKMKSMLREYIEREYEGTEELPVDLNLNEVREWYDMMNEGKMLPFDERREKQVSDLPWENEVPEDEPAVSAPTTKSSSVSDRLSSLRNRMKK